LAQACNYERGFHLHIGIGVNVASAPSEAICLAELSEIDLSKFIALLSSNLVAFTKQADLGGVRDIMKLIEFEHMGKQIAILDHTLTKTLYTGKFVGINDFGHARIERLDGEVIEVMEGRMRLI
jgi:biotin-(acetyl-CoA carboxylase) ligase